MSEYSSHRSLEQDCPVVQMLTNWRWVSPIQARHEVFLTSTGRSRLHVFPSAYLQIWKKQLNKKSSQCFSLKWSLPPMWTSLPLCFKGMLSHQLKQHVIDGEKTIIQNPTDQQRYMLKEPGWSETVSSPTILDPFIHFKYWFLWIFHPSLCSLTCFHTELQRAMLLS